MMISKEPNLLDLFNQRTMQTLFYKFHTLHSPEFLIAGKKLQV